MATVGDLSKKFDVSTGTVKNWSQEFADYLSPSANPREGEARAFNEADSLVMAFIAHKRNNQQSYNEIHEALKAGEHENFIPPVNPNNDDPGRQLQVINRLTIKAAELQGQLSAITGERDELRARLDKAQQQLIDLTAKAAHAEGRLSAIEERPQPPAVPQSDPPEPAPQEGEETAVDQLKKEIEQLKSQLEKEQARTWWEKLRGK